MSYLITELAPGCDLIYKQINSPVAHIAIFTECGTRHEQSYPEGIAHFLEHMIFKGTKKRKTFHILAGLENTGCDVNAFTSKEELVVHASFLEEHGKRIVHLLGEILFESDFPAIEIEKERNVIIDEIASLKDSPADLLFEQFERQFYGRHPLHREILGKESTLKKIDRDVLLSFYNNIFLKSRKVVVYFGNKSYAKVLSMLQSAVGKYIGNIEHHGTKHALTDAKTHLFQKTERMNTHQIHAVMGAPAYDMRNPKKNTFGLLMNILGGQSFNSRLNLLVREKLGLSYAIDASFNIFADNGYYSVYFSTERNNVQRVIRLIHKELKKLREQKIGTLQLHIAKKQMIGQTAIFLESVGSDMLSAGKVFMYTGKVPGFDEIRTNIEQITSEDLLDVANELLDSAKLSSLIYEPKD